MNGPAGRSTGEGGGAVGLGKPPWGGKGGPILSQDLNRHDGSWSRRHGRCRPASLHNSDRYQGRGYWGGFAPFSWPAAGGALFGGAGEAYFWRGGRLTSNR